MKVNQDLEISDTPPFEIIFWVNKTESYKNLKGQDFVNT